MYYVFYSAQEGGLTYKVLNALGLLLDIIGGLLLWRFGLPAPIDPRGHTHLTLSQEDEEEKRLGRIYKCWSSLGVGLLVAGFALQLVATLLP